MKCVMRLVPEEHTEKWLVFACVFNSNGKHVHTHHKGSRYKGDIYRKVKISRSMWNTRIEWGKRKVYR